MSRLSDTLQIALHCALLCSFSSLVVRTDNVDLTVSNVSTLEDHLKRSTSYFGKCIS